MYVYIRMYVCIHIYTRVFVYIQGAMWMVVQLAEQDTLSALNAFFTHLQPVLEAEGAHKGALGVQVIGRRETLVGLFLTLLGVFWH